MICQPPRSLLFHSIFVMTHPGPRWWKKSQRNTSTKSRIPLWSESNGPLSNKTYTKAGPTLAPVRSRRAAEKQRSHQAQHQREPLSPLSQSLVGNQSCRGWPFAPLSKSHGATFARKARQTASLQTGKHHPWQWLG